jgi:hypothetical protein
MSFAPESLKHVIAGSICELPAFIRIYTMTVFIFHTYK